MTTGPAMGAHGGAVAFTLLVALGLAGLATTFPRWSADVLGALDRKPSVAPAPSSVPPTPVPTAPAAAALSSAWVSQSGYPGIVVGGTATITLTFRNTGSATWRRGTPSEARLGIVGDPGYDPSMALDWPFPERPAVQGEAVVAPQQIATFTFKARGTHPGTFRLRVRPVVDGVAWLNDEGVYVDVEVR